MAINRQPEIDRDVAQRCVIDLTTVLGRTRREINGMRRLEFETARALLAAGGRAVSIDAAAGLLRDVDRDTLARLFGDEGAHRPETATPVGAFGTLLERILRRKRAPTPAPAFSPHAQDVLLLFGEYWTMPVLDIIRALARRRAMRIVPLVYDIMPIRRPELFWNSNPGWDNEKFMRVFRESVRTFADASDRVLSISEFSRADFLRFCGEEGLTPPATGVVPLASDLDCSVAPLLTARLREKNFAERSFALMVSNVEPRKNHAFAYQLWRRLADRLGPRTMPLVLAGQRGWQTEDLMVHIENDAAMWGRHIHFVEAPTDGELAWLYANAAFTVFPSELEGWGLPITESLAFGTPCLAADNSSLREASQGLAWHADTLDGATWMAETERCMLDPAHLETVRAAIAARFVRRRWTDFLADVLREVCEIPARAGA